MTEENKKIKKSVFKKIFLAVLIVVTIAFLAVIPLSFKGYQMYEQGIREISIQEKILEVKSDENYVKIKDISPLFLLGVLASEDQSFYRHNGIDYKSTARAIINNIKARKLVEGGSTITQQLSKNLYFTFEKKFERKVAEIFVVRRLENQLSKNEIFELYCNIAYFGEGNYGIGEATLYYYDKLPSELTSEEATILVKTLKSPSYYNPQTILEDGD